MSIWDAVREMEGVAPRQRRAAQASPFWQDWARLEGVQTQRPAIERMIAQAAARHGVPFDLAIAVARAESGLDPQARSRAGAIGVMQLMPSTARALGVDPHDIRQNIEGGVRYLRQMYDKFRDWRLAVAAYNAGPGAVERYGGVPPFQETREYVRRVFTVFAPTGRLRTEEERRQAGQALMPRIQERREREQREIQEILEREFGGRPPSEEQLRRSPLLRMAVDIPRHVVRGALPILPIRTTREEAAVRGQPIEAFGRFGPRVEVPLPGGQRLEVQPSLEGIIGAAAEFGGALLTGQPLVRGLRAVAPGLMARLEQLPLRYALGNVSLGALVGAVQAAADLAPEVRAGRISPSEAASRAAQQAGLTGAAFGALHAGITGTLHAVRAGRVAVSQLRSLADDLRAVQRAVGPPEALPPAPVEQRPAGFYEPPRPRPTAAVEAEPKPVTVPEARPAVPAAAAPEPTRPTAVAPTPARPAPQPTPAAAARPAAVPRLERPEAYLPEELPTTLRQRTVDTSRPADHAAVISRLESGNVGAWDEKSRTIVSYHVTTDPDRVLRQLKAGSDLRITGVSLGDKGRGLYVSGVPEYWIHRGRVVERVVSLARQRNKVPDLLDWLEREVDRMRDTRYISESEATFAKRLISDLRANRVRLDAVTELFGQPYNASWEEAARVIGVEPKSLRPARVRVELSGRFLDLTDMSSDEFEALASAAQRAAQAAGLLNDAGELTALGKRVLRKGLPDQEALNWYLQQLGYDGVYTRSGFASTPELVVWNPQAVRAFGTWRNPRPAPAAARPTPEPARPAAPEAPEPTPAGVEAAPERPAAVAARPEPETAPAEVPTETPPAPPPPRAAPSPPPAQPAPVPEPPLTVRQVVIRTARGSEERGRLAVVDLGDLVTSHTPEGTPRPEYAEHGGVQPRARERAGSRAQIIRIAQQLDPDMLLADTPDAASGTPVVAPSAAGEPKWVVESGNARVAALQLASRRYPERYQAYVDALKERLRQAGQDPDLVDRMVQEGRTPVLVRVRETGLDPAGRARFAAEANEAAVLRMSPAEQAATDAARISDEMLSDLAVGYDLASPQNRPFVRAFLAQLAPEEQAALLTETGDLSRAGVERVRAAILARAYQDDRLLQLALEDVDPDVRNVLSVLTSLSGRVARYRGLVSRGAAWEQLDISRDLAAAAVQYNRLARESTPLETWLAQTQLFGELGDEARAIMRLFAEHRRSQRKLASVLQAYYDIAERAGGPSDPVLPGMERPAPPKPLEILERARAAADAQQAVLFRATSPVPVEVKRSVFAPEGAETVKVHDIVARLQELFSVPIRMRRMGRVRAAGFYKVLPQVIRRKVYADFQTIYHELGHHLDNLLELSQTAPSQEELLALFRASGLPTSTYKTRQVQIKEGVAEFVRRLYTDPASAQQLAPGFWTHFWSRVGASDRLADALEQSIRDYRRWAGQSSWAMVSSMIAEAGERRGPTTPYFWRLYEEFVTDLAPLQRMLSDLGVDPKEGVNPVSLGQVMRGWVGHAEAMLERGVVDRTGRRLAPGLYEILRPIEGQLDDFRTYAVARRALELMRQGKTTGFEHLTDHLLTVAREGAQRGYDKVFENMVAWQNAMVKATLVDSGLLPEDVARRMFERHTAYVPFYRLFDEAGWSSVGSGRGLYGVRPPIRKLAGSTRPVEDPLVNILANTYAYAQAAAKQRVLTSITRLTKYKGAGAWIEEVPAPAVAQKLNVGRLLEELAGVLDLSKTELEQLLGKHGQDYVVLFSPASWPGRKELKERVLPIYDPRAGRIRWYQLHPDLHRFVTYNPSEAMANVLVRILGPIARTLRLGAVLDLGFILRNITRDQFTAAVQSRYGYFPFLDAMRGLVHALRKDEVWEMWATSGGSGSALASIDRNYLRGQLQKLFGRRSIGSQILGNASLDRLQALSELFENATRLGEFSRAIRKEAGKYGVEATWAGLSKLPAAKREEILVKAALASREVTLDFGRAGRSGRTINSISAFWNARVQGLDKLVRVFRDDPYGATLRAVTWITIPSVVLWWLNKDNPEYRELSAWRKLLFWHLPVPWWDGRVHLIPIPKPWELGLLFGGLAESLMEWLYRRDPEGIRQHMRALIAQPVNDLLMGFFPTAVQPVVEAVANYSFFRDRPIVPLSEQRLPPELQYGPWQTEASKGLAQLIKRLTGAGVSPRVIEHLVRGYTGTLGMTALGLPDIVLGGTRRSLVAPIERIPGVSAFVERPLAEPESIQRFYRRLQSMEREQAREAAELGAERLAPTPELATMRRAQRQLAELRRQMTAVQSDPTIPPDRKRRLVREITIAMIQTARAAMGLEPLQLQP